VFLRTVPCQALETHFRRTVVGCALAYTTRIAQPQAIHDAWTIVFDNDVTLRCQRYKDVHTTRVFVIQRQALLVAVEHRKHRGLAVLQLPQNPCRVTADHGFDLDHLGTHVG